MNEFKELATNPSSWLFTFGVGALLGVWFSRMNVVMANMTLVLMVIAFTLAASLYPLVASGPIRTRLITTLFTGAGLSIFIYYTLWTPLTPVGLFARTSSAKQPNGAVIGNIPWSDKYREVRVTITNNSNRNVEAIDLVVRPDQPVAAVAQVTNISDVSFTPNDPPVVEMQELETADRRTVMPTIPLATLRGYRVRCDALPRRSRLELVMAAVTINETGDGSGADKVLRVNYNSGQAAWFAHPGHSGAVFALKPTVKEVFISGQYTVAEREHNVSRRLKTVDFFKGIPRKP